MSGIFFAFDDEKTTAEISYSRAGSGEPGSLGSVPPHPEKVLPLNKAPHV